MEISLENLYVGLKELTRFAAMLHNKLHIFVACFNFPLDLHTSNSNFF